MKRIGEISLFPEPEPTKAKSQRQELLGEFIEAINASRNGQTVQRADGKQVQVKPLSAAFIASKMARAGVKTEHDLYRFLQECKRAKNFSTHWWWALDSKNARKSE